MERQDILRVLASPDLFRIPADILVAAIWCLLNEVFIITPLLSNTILRPVLALPVVLFIPGYSLVAALFPQRGDLDLIERNALSFGLSIAVVPLIGLVLNYTPWGIRLIPVLVSLTLFTLTMLVTAHIRRLVLPPEERFHLPMMNMVSEARAALFPEGGSGLDRALSIILILSILAAIGATIFVIVVPKVGERFTEFYILGERGKAADYPHDLIPGREYPIIIGIGNHEYRNVTYTVEIHLMNITFDTNGSRPELHASELLDRFEVTLLHNTTREIPWNLSVGRPGFNRVEFLLFNETLPSDDVYGLDRIDAAYRDLHLWVECRSPSS